MATQKEYRYGNHTVTRLSVHLVWVTKYRYPILTGDIRKRIREIIVQICDAEDVHILSGVVSKDHIHLHIEYPPKLSLSDFVQSCKGRSSRLIQKEFPTLGKRYWGNHFWAVGYAAFSTGNITDAMIEEYLKHHFSQHSNQENAIDLQ
jgi:putative transposase